jgi:hypothetical protein
MEQRGVNGRFLVGHKGGPGNPYARRVAEFKNALYSAVSSDDITAIALKLVSNAREGDIPAAKLLLSYAIGAPIQNIQLDAEVASERQIRLDQYFESIPANQLLDILRHASSEI